MPRSRSNSPRSSQTEAAAAPQTAGAATAVEEGVDDLSYNEARTALDLTLAELQASDLEVEAMGALYRRAEAYARRCEHLLERVEQEVALWNGDNPSEPPLPYQP